MSSINLPGKYYIIVNGLEKKYTDQLVEIADKYYLDLQIIDIGHSTRGQAETCLLALETGKIDLNEQLVITNCDMLVRKDNILEIVLIIIKHVKKLKRVCDEFKFCFIGILSITLWLKGFLL